MEKYGKNYVLNSESVVYNGLFVLDGFDGFGIDIKWLFKKND